MSHNMEQELYRKYPKIFAQKDLPMNQTAMCWGICVSKGWQSLLDTLCQQIQAHIDNKNWQIKYKKEKGELPQDAPEYPQVEATQVKEKFGGLRFYVNRSDEYIDGLISMAEAMSYAICEYCGNPGKPNEDGWISTQCDPCRVGEEERRKKAQEAFRDSLTVKMKDVTVAP